MLHRLFAIALAAVIICGQSAFAQPETACPARDITSANDPYIGYAPDREVLLRVNYNIFQEESTWCWAAVTKIALGNILPTENYHQCEIVTARKIREWSKSAQGRIWVGKNERGESRYKRFDSSQDIRCCNTKNNPDASEQQICNAKGGWPDFKAFSKKVKLPDAYNTGFSLDRLKRELDGRHNDCRGAPAPFIWNWVGGKRTHALLAAGYKKSGRDHYIFVVDPDRSGLRTKAKKVCSRNKSGTEICALKRGRRADRSLVLHSYYLGDRGSHKLIYEYRGLRAK